MIDNPVSRFAKKLIQAVHVEFKIPFILGEIKLDASNTAKEWWVGERKQKELEHAITEAERKFYRKHRDDKVAQILHDFSLAPEQEFQRVIIGLLNNPDEEKITWFAEVEMQHWWSEYITEQEVRTGLKSYLPYLRHELSEIKEFEEIISVLRDERIDKNTQETVEIVREIRSDLKEVLKSQIVTNDDELDFWYIPHPYPMPPNFTGRDAEQQMLDNWLTNDKDRLFIFRALGGFGKSALAWQWINTHVNPAEWNKLVWWSFYEGDASFEHFIEETLRYLKLDVPQGQRPQVDELLKAMQSQKILLVVDGFERALRAYSGMNAAYQGDDEPKFEDKQLDCVNINAEFFLKGVCSLPNIQSKVLMTARLTPRTVKPRGECLQGCREEELTAMQKADAVEFFHKQKIKGTHAEIEAACASYGYHPLSLRLLAGRILKDFENPADIVVAQKLTIDGDIIQQKHHVLEVSYNSLPPHEGKLLSTIACFRSSVELKTLEVVTVNKKILNESLRDLTERGLLHFDDQNKKFDIHPIVRHYSYKQISIKERIIVHQILCKYFSGLPKPLKLEKIDDLDTTIELYHHLVKAQKYENAFNLYRDTLSSALFFQFGAYQTIVDLLTNLISAGQNEFSHFKSQPALLYALGLLGSDLQMMGLSAKAVFIFEQTANVSKELFTKSKNNDNRNNLAINLLNLASMQITIGRFKKSEEYLQQQLELSSKLDNKFTEASGRQKLGHLLIYRGKWEDAKRELINAWNMFGKRNIQMKSVTAAYRSFHGYLLARKNYQKKYAFVTNQKLAYEFAQRSLTLAKEGVEKGEPVERDFIRAYWMLGTACRINNQLNLAEKHLSDALTRDRAINLVEMEADILLDLARLRYDQQKFEEAKSLADEALTITERCGYVLQGADVNLFLAQYALEQEKDSVKAKEYAEEAKKLATCDGPPYYYKVAYEEAERMLERLKAEG